MNVLQLKFIAIAAMIIDHIGLYFFPDILAFRVVGRISFPIFAWLIANGARHTHDSTKYLMRLLIFALLSQPFFYLSSIVIDPAFQGFNVLFTLFIGLLGIVFMHRIKNKFLWIVVIGFLAAVANIIKTDYGAMGVLSIVFFYLFYNNKLLLILSQVFIYAGAFWLWMPFVHSGPIHAYLPTYILELVALLSLFLIIKYNGREGRGLKYLFYFFYPIQYVVIYFLQRVL